MNNKLSRPGLWLVSTNDAVTSDFRLRQTRDDQTLHEAGFPDVGMEAYPPDVAVGDDQEKKKEVVEELQRIGDVKWPLGGFGNIGVPMSVPVSPFLLKLENVAVMSMMSTVSGWVHTVGQIVRTLITLLDYQSELSAALNSLPCQEENELLKYFKLLISSNRTE